MPSNAPDGKGAGGDGRDGTPNGGKPDEHVGPEATPNNARQRETNNARSGMAGPRGVSEEDTSSEDSWGSTAFGIIGGLLGLPTGVMALGQIALGGPKAAADMAAGLFSGQAAQAIGGPLGALAAMAAKGPLSNSMHEGMLSGTPSLASGGEAPNMSQTLSARPQVAPQAPPQVQQQPQRTIPQFAYQQPQVAPQGLPQAQPQFAYQQPQQGMFNNLPRSINT